MKKLSSIVKKVLLLCLAAIMLLPATGCKKSSGDGSSDYEIVYEYESDSQSGIDSNKQSADKKSGKSESGTGSKKTGGGTTKQTDGSKANNGKTVTVYSWNAADAVTGAKSVIKKFENQTGMTVNWKTGSYDNYATEIAALVAADKAPDVVRLKGYEYSVMGLMDPISVANYDFSDSKVWDQNVIKYYTVGNKQYGVNMVGTPLQQPVVIAYNKSLLPKAGGKDPYQLWKQGKWTWETFTEMIETYTQNTGKTAWSTHMIYDYAVACGQPLVLKNGDTLKANLDNADLRKCLKDFATMREKKQVEPEPWMFYKLDNGTNLFLTTPDINARTTHFNLTTLKKSKDLRMVPFPTIGGKPYNQMYEEYEAYGFGKGCKNPNGAAQFLSFYLNPNNYDLDEYFPDKTMWEVHKWCLNQANVSVCADKYVLTKDNSAFYRELQVVQLGQATSQQIGTKLDSQSGKINELVEFANQKFARLR